MIRVWVVWFVGWEVDVVFEFRFDELIVWVKVVVFLFWIRLLVLFCKVRFEVFWLWEDGVGIVCGEDEWVWLLNKIFVMFIVLYS